MSADEVYRYSLADEVEGDLGFAAKDEADWPNMHEALRLAEAKAAQRMKQWVLWILLNPSKADATRTDPTMMKVRGFTQRMGYAGWVICNLFAFRSTDPRALRDLSLEEAVGPENDRHLMAASARADKIIVGWGCRGILHGRDETVRKMLEPLGKPLWALKIAKEGDPWHPLYVPYNAVLKPWPVSGGGMVSSAA
jgi:hypothetical protein